MGVLNKDELSDVLNVLFNQMQEQKMLPPQLISDKTQIIEQVAENLSNNCEIDKSDLQKPALQKALCVSLISQGVANKNPDPNAYFADP